MPICVRCKHEVETQICGACGDAMANDIIELQSKLEELEREIETTKQWIENHSRRLSRIEGR